MGRLQFVSSLFILAVLFVAPSESREAGEEIYVTLEAPGGMEIQSGVAVVYFEGAHLNSSPWAKSLDPISPIEFLSLAQGAGRMPPLEFVFTGAVVKIQVPEGASSAWVEVGQVKVRHDGAMEFAGAGVIGPIKITKGRTSARLPLDAPRTIEGSVRIPEGSRSTDVIVYATPHRWQWQAALPNWPGIPQAETVVSEDGRFVLSGLGSLTYTVEVIPPSDLCGPRAVKVDAASTKNSFMAPLVVSKAAAVQLTLTDSLGKPVGLASVRCVVAGEDGIMRDLLPESIQPWFAASEHGTVKLTGLCVGRTYSLVVSVPNERNDLLPVVRIRKWVAQRVSTVVLPSRQ